MFSGRIPAHFQANRLTEALDARRRDGLPVLDLAVTNPTHAGLPGPGPELWAEKAGSSTDYDPHPAGLESARRAVAGYYAERGTPVDPGQIVLTASTSEAYAFLFKLLSDPGGEFLVPAPSYPLFEPLAALEGVSLEAYPIRYDGRWWIDREALEGSFSPSTRGLLVVEPNNPTGSVLNDAEIAAVSSLARRRGVPVVADQVFGDFMAGPEPLPAFFARNDDVLSFTLSGLSKVCGLPQLKLGWIVVSGPRAEAEAALERLEWICDVFLSVSTPVQRALPGLLAERRVFQDAVRARIAENERRLDEILGQAPGIERLPREGGWSFVLRVPRTRPEEEWCLALLGRGVLLHPGHFYDFEREAWLVGSLITPPPVLREGLERLVELAVADG